MECRRGTPTGEPAPRGGAGLNPEEINRLLEAARESLAAARWNLRGGFHRTAVNRAYYAMFYAAEALLLRMGLTFSRHSAVIAAFGRELVASGKLPPKLHEYLYKAFEARQAADYRTTASISAEAAEAHISRAGEFLTAIEEALSGWPD